MDVVLAQPRGFCAGVVRAIGTVERALESHGAPIYVFHEIVHNAHVVDDLRGRGAVFVDNIDDIPRGAVTVFSAHGVSKQVVAQAQARQLRIIDATCPLVAKVHLQAQRYAALGYTIVVIGHRGHEEVEGTVGSIDEAVHLVATLADIEALAMPRDAHVAYVTQTTLSLDDTRELIAALQHRYPAIQGPDVSDICYATQNRQAAVRQLARRTDVVLVVGARNSSNSNRLREVASQEGAAAFLIQDADEIQAAWFEGVARVGVTAGASAPEVLVTGVRKRLAQLGVRSFREMEGEKETIRFRLPPRLPAGPAAIPSSID